MYIPESDGLHCKACDAMLGVKHPDRELCSVCLEAVYAILTNEETGYESFTYEVSESATERDGEIQS